LFHAINRIPAISAFKTPANFIFARLNGSRDMDDMICRLLNKGLFIRDCRNFEGLDGNFFRIAVLGKENNIRLIQALTDIFGNSND
jgi:threonine-phosphate decarboxylase